MTDAQGNQLTYRQIAEHMTLKPWVRKERPPPDLTPALEAPAKPA
jgi:hypothetical protein